MIWLHKPFPRKLATGGNRSLLYNRKHDRVAPTSLKLNSASNLYFLAGAIQQLEELAEESIVSLQETYGGPQTATKRASAAGKVLIE